MTTLTRNLISDLTIFDKKTINGKATVTNLNQFSEAIDHVFVNGKLTFSKEQIIGPFGAPIKYQNI